MSYRHVFVEPHFDDVALSCGGAVLAACQRAEPVLVVTLFAGNPGAHAAVTDFAAGQHARWGGAVDPIAERVREQRAALALLGADWQRMDWLDAIYRGDRYLSDDDLFGQIKDEGPLVEEIEQALRAIALEHAGARWYAPLGLGHHVDHQIARTAAKGLRPLHYEDFPYATKARPTGSPTLTVDVDLERKIAAIGCYRSQIPTLFGDMASMERAVRGFFQSGERYWL